MKTKPQKIDQEMEKAIIMLADCVSKKCRNPKPLILHGIRAGFKLLELKQPTDVVIAGILHDLVEDTDCTIGQIKKAFGQKVAELILDVTQEKIKDYKKGWRLLMKKIKKSGKSAMMLKLVDMNENLTYIPFVRSRKELKEIRWKNEFGMNQLKPYLGKTKLFLEYQNGYRKVFKKLGIKQITQKGT